MARARVRARPGIKLGDNYKKQKKTKKTVTPTRLPFFISRAETRACVHTFKTRLWFLIFNL